MDSLWMMKRFMARMVKTCRIKGGTENVSVWESKRVDLVGVLSYLNVVEGPIVT